MPLPLLTNCRSPETHAICKVQEIIHKQGNIEKHFFGFSDNLCYSYVYPYLTYCLKVWRCASISNQTSIFILVTKNIRIITLSHCLAHLTQLFMSLGILPLEKLFYDRCDLVMYTFYNKMLPY